MGNLMTKNTTNNIELNESSASDIVVYDQQQAQVKKDKTSLNNQAKSGLFKNVFLSTLDPRSPSTFITRTPIQIFRSVSSSKFNHEELMNESLNESVEIDILTAEEQKSLDSNLDLVDAINIKNDEATNLENKLPDPRSPGNEEIVRTPILIIDDTKKADNNMIKKISDKLIATKLSNDSESQNKTTPTGIIKKKSKPTKKNLIYEDNESQNHDRFSTPPKKSSEAIKDNKRTPLSCVANKTRSSQRPQFTSTPKGSKIPVSISKDHHHSASVSRIPRRIE